MEYLAEQSNVLLQGKLGNMSSRTKGQRSVSKARTFAKVRYPHAFIMTIYQTSYFSTPAPFDLLILDLDAPALLVEVRTSQWGVSKPQTRTLAGLPGQIRKEIWLFERGQTVPRIRTWSGTAWIQTEEA